MTPERLAQIRALYEKAIATEGLEREAFLNASCKGDEGLRREVEVLLFAQERVPDWLHRPVLGTTIQSASAPMGCGVSMEGQQFGAYKLIREIGRGGMGFVYLAERADGTFHKQVAIKFIQPGMNSAGIIERFQREREILAALDHPNIARLIDAGATPDGLPYFVMEYVEGQPIQRWCEERKLSVTERVELFRTVCAAVEYAHQHLVVHRDLKPSNILVTPDGTVKLLDFGISRFLRPEESSKLMETGDVDRVLTPEYASPEQIKGGRITTLTDVYSLGVVLYELLTGRRPYSLKKAALMEMVRVISEEEPTRPSEIVTAEQDQAEAAKHAEAVDVPEGDARRLQKRLVGDLDCILLNALRKEPDRRYRSVAAFSEDLGRHLEHFPVQARTDGFWYRAGRFVHRHPSGVLAGALIAISTATGLLTAVWQTRLLLSLNLPGDTALAPLVALFASLVLTALGCAIYFTRATLRRARGALVGGVALATGSLAKYWIADSVGWWHISPERIPVHSIPAMYITAALAGGMLLLIIWRVIRRLGPRSEIPLILFMGLATPLRERMWMTALLDVMTVDPGINPYLGDAALWTIVWALGVMTMKLIAGPAGADRLARGVTK